MATTPAPAADHPATPFWLTPSGVAACVLAFAGVCALLLALPAETVSTKYVNDLLIFLDGAYRVASGEVPNRDFHTALGPFAYYLPAAGYLLSGQLGAAMPLGMALFVALLGLATAHVLASRFSAAVALPFAALLLLVAAVPMNLGEGFAEISFGMFYNRLGWAALALLLAMYLEARSRGPRQTWLDALTAAVLVVFMVYLKISYGLIGLAFVGLLLLHPAHRRWAAIACGLIAATALAAEAIWRATAGYVQDIALAASVSGPAWRDPATLVPILARHLADLTLFGLFVGLALWRRPSARDLAFYGFCAVSGILIISQNFQTWGLVTLFAGAAVAAEMVLRMRAQKGRNFVTDGAGLLFLGFVLPTIVHCAIALGTHAALAAARAGEPFGLPGFERMRIAETTSPGDYAFSLDYVKTLRDGARLLAQLEPKPGRVWVMDFVSPFSAGLGLVPPRGDGAWEHWGRNIDAAHFQPPEALFADVAFVMEPKRPADEATTAGLREVYGGYVAAHFDLVAETDFWRLHRARDSGAAPSHSAAAGAEP